MEDTVGCKRAADDPSPAKAPKTDARLVFIAFVNGEGMLAYNWPFSALPAEYAAPLTARIQSGQWKNPIIRIDCDDPSHRKKQQREMREYDPTFDMTGLVSALHDMKETHQDGLVVDSNSRWGLNAVLHVISIEPY